MAGNNRMLDDIVLTTFDDDTIFVIHPKPRRNSNQSLQTVEIELDHSSSNFAFENHEQDITDLDIQANHQINHNEHAIEIDSVEPERNQCKFIPVRDCWERFKLYVSNAAKEVSNWTIIQTWHNMAFLQFMVPFLIRKKSGTEQHEKQSFRPQQVLWSISMVLLVVEMLSWIPKFLRGLEENPNPYTYINMATFLAEFLLRCSFLKLVCCDEELIIDFLNLNTKLMESLPTHLKAYIRGRTITLITSILFLILNLIYVILSIILQTYVSNLSWVYPSVEFVHIYACYGKRVYLWMGDCSYDDELPLTTSDILFGILGLATFINGVMCSMTSLLCLLSCTFTLLMSAIALKQTDLITTSEKYDLLNDMSNGLSYIVGGILTLYMLNFATAMPDWIRLAFQQQKIYVVFVSFNIFLLLAFAITGSLASLYIDRIKSQLMDSDEDEEIPTDLHRLRQLMIGQFKHLKIFLTSTGIGFPGLYVLNFRLLFSYAGIICSVIVVIHETVKDIKDGEAVTELQGNKTMLLNH